MSRKTSKIYLCICIFICHIALRQILIEEHNEYIVKCLYVNIRSET